MTRKFEWLEAMFLKGKIDRGVVVGRISQAEYDDLENQYDHWREIFTSESELCFSES